MVSPITISGLAVNETFVIHGIFSANSLRLIGNQGSVHVDNCFETSSLSEHLGEVRDCSQVTFSGCDLRNGLRCLRSSVVISDSVVRGFGDLFAPSMSVPGISAVDSSVFLSLTAVWGHDSVQPCRSCQQYTTASPGVVSLRSNVLVG